MSRTHSPNRVKAQKALAEIPKLPPESWQATATVAAVYALLEVAFQLGRIADNVPLFGPAEER